MTELLPCPFCGRDSVVVARAHNDSSDAREVTCECGAFVWASTEAKAVRNWNRRASDDRLELAKLERDEARDRLLPMKARLVRMEQEQQCSDRLIDQLRFERGALIAAEIDRLKQVKETA
jgi:Lar family restriction alleviation protein